MAIAGIPLVTYKILHQPSSTILLAISPLVTLIISYIFFRLALFGGADAKALICISFISFARHANPTLGIFSLDVLSNAALLALFVAPSLCIYNLVRLSWAELKDDPWCIFIGYKLAVTDLHPKVRLVHEYEQTNDKLTKKFAFGGLEIDEDGIERLMSYVASDKIEDKIWVTPSLPFILFITLGFIATSLYGNIPFSLITWVLT